MKKKVSFKLFFTVLFRGLYQLLTYPLKLWGYKSKNKYLKFLWRTTVTCMVCLLVMLTLAIGKVFHKEVLNNCFTSGGHYWIIEEDISHYIKLERDYYDRYRIYDQKHDKVLYEDVVCVTYDSKTDSIALVCLKGKFCYIDRKTGAEIIPIHYDQAWIFSEGLAAVEIEGKIVFINMNGEIVIDNGFEALNYQSDYVFYGGYSLMETNDGKSGIIDKSGQWALEPVYDDIKYVDNDSLWVINHHGKYAILNQKLDTLISLGGTYYNITDDYIYASTPDHIVKKFDKQGRLVDDFYVLNVDEMFALSPEFETVMTEVYDEYGNMTSKTEDVNGGRRKVPTSCLKYESEPQYYGLMSANGEILTNVSFA